MAIEFGGFLYQDDGTAINGATVNLYDKNTTTPVRATTTTNASGYWTISHGTDGEFDVEIVSGSSKRRIKHDDARMFEEITLADSNRLTFGSGGDADIYYDGTNLIIEPRVVGSGNLVINDECQVWIGPAGAGGTQSNSLVTTGLTINQEAADNEILAFKSSDIAHGLTSQTETDTFMFVHKLSATTGGVNLGCMAEDDASTVRSLFIECYGGTAQTTKTTGGIGLVDIQVSEHNGANALANIAADGNVFSVRAQVGGSIVTRWMVDEDGDTFLAGTADTALDAFDDWQLAAGFQALTLKQPEPAVRSYKRYWGDTLRDAEEFLVQAGVLTAPLKEGGMISTAAFNGLVMDLFRSAYDHFQSHEQRIQALEKGILKG